MKISTKFRYGARALAELARVDPRRTVPARELAELQGLSVKYLENILSALKAAGIVRSERGMGGGYQLAGRPDQITMLAVFHALEGSTAPVQCVEDPVSCNRSPGCPVRPTWIEIRDAVTEVLESTSLAELAERMREGGQGMDLPYQDYQI